MQSHLRRSATADAVLLVAEAKGRAFSGVRSSATFSTEAMVADATYCPQMQKRWAECLMFEGSTFYPFF